MFIQESSVYMYICKNINKKLYNLGFFPKSKSDTDAVLNDITDLEIENAKIMYVVFEAIFLGIVPMI